MREPPTPSTAPPHDRGPGKRVADSASLLCILLADAPGLRRPALLLRRSSKYEDLIAPIGSPSSTLGGTGILMTLPHFLPELRENRRTAVLEFYRLQAELLSLLKAQLCRLTE